MTVIARRRATRRSVSFNRLEVNHLEPMRRLLSRQLSLRTRSAENAEP